MGQLLRLEPAWMQAIDVAAKLALRASDISWSEPARLGDQVRALSDTYTHARDGLRAQEKFFAARMRFFLPRDLPKIEAPLHELWRSHVPSQTLRILDVGAGYGTTTFGLLRALSARKANQGGHKLEVHAVDQDAQALRCFTMLAKHVPTGANSLHVQTYERDFRDLARLPKGAFDLILLGLSLNETPSASALEYLHGLAAYLSDQGSIIIIEPALRETTRQLQSIGESFRADDNSAEPNKAANSAEPNKASKIREANSLSIVGPCLGRGSCPMLPRERDWCHQDVDVELPDALVPVAKAAGLRFSGLSYAYLTLSKRAPITTTMQRVVGGPIEAKGQREWMLCSSALQLMPLRLNRRDATQHPLAETLRRGDMVELFDLPTHDERPQIRLGSDARIESVQGFTA